MIPLAQSEAAKLFTARPTWILCVVIVLGTWAMAWTNSASTVDLPADSELLFSSEPIPREYQGLEMAGFGYVLIVVFAALWAGSEYGSGTQIRTTLLATPKRLRVFVVKVGLLAAFAAAIAFLTMTGTLMITHAIEDTGIDPWTLSPAVWTNIGGVTSAWTMTALIAFAVGALARTMILPLILIVPLVIGIGDFIVGFWSGAKFLPMTAGAAMYSDPASGGYLDPAVGGLVQAVWTVSLLIAAAFAFTRRDL